MRRSRCITVVHNARSGPGATTSDALADIFREAGAHAEVRALAPGDDPARAARDVMTADPTGTVVAAGGDGTVSSVAGVLAGTNAVLGIMPVGTLNHFARDLHIPLKPADAAAVIVQGRIATVDVGRVNDRIFVNNASIGVYPTLVSIRETFRLEGHGKMVAAARALLAMPRYYRGEPLRLQIGGRERQVRTPFLFVGNNEYASEGLQLGSRAALDTGRLVAYLAPRVRSRDLPGLWLRALLRRSRKGEFEIIAADDFRVDSLGPRRLRIALDGELAALASPLQFRAWPKALRVCVPGD